MMYYPLAHTSSLRVIQLYFQSVGLETENTAMNYMLSYAYHSH